MRSSHFKLIPILFFQAAVVFTQAPLSSASDQAEAVKGSNAFAVDLYAQLRGQPGNLFFSPESISADFAMAYAGARGQTATEIEKVFHFALPPDRLHPAMGALLAQMNAQHQAYELHVADALWAQKDASFLPAYMTLVQTDYAAGFRPVDFKSSPEAVRATINQWVEQQTNNKIQNLLGPGTVTSATRLLLTNAIYFKGTWLNPFDGNYTEDEEFHLSAKQSIKTPMMNRNGSYRYYDGGTFQALELPYAGNKLSMVVLLSKDTEGLPALEKSFTSAAANEWIQKLEPVGKVILTLPRFTLTQQFELSSTLSAMGMPQAFSGAADFSGMTGKPDFTISAAIHKAFIDVNEQGTEAAAATAIEMVATAMQRPNNEPPPIVFDADHPFLFLIRDTSTGAILFLGRVTDPTK
ncbi:MAG: serpin family protein [Terracidiphilus sp.]|jgi:serpin B